MLHVRVVSPAALTRPLTDRLAAAQGVYNVEVRAGAARRPAGDAVICVERVDATLTGLSAAGVRHGALRRETAPVWEMVEAVIRDGAAHPARDLGIIRRE